MCDVDDYGGKGSNPPTALVPLNEELKRMKKTMSTLLALLTCGACLVITAAPGSPVVTQMNATSSMSGTLTGKNGKFFLRDQVTRTMVEVRGQGLQKFVGSKVNVTGQLQARPSGSLQVLNASEVSRAVAVSTRAAAAGVKTGLSKAAVVGVAGTATATTVGTLYATDVISGDETAVSRK